MKWLLAVLCWLSAAGVFFGMFFKLAPYVCGLVPPGQWQGLIKVGIYFAIAYLGGLGLPFMLILVSYMILQRSKQDWPS